MSTSFPVAIDTLTNPAATDGLAGHAQQHANANDAIEALQAKVGVTGSANPESIDYRVASVESGKVDKAAGKQLSTEDYSTVEKQKLAGIEAGANAYTHPATHSAAMVDTDSTHRFVTDTQAAAWDSKAAGSHVGSGGTAHAAVTTSVDGFMSAPDKVKLNAISGTNTGDETATTIKAKLGIATLSGVNTGDQTSVTGNAGTATKLQTARTINGVSFDGGANITINAVDSTARIALSEKGAANGVAPLGVDSKIAASYLPSYVDDVLEYANQAAFPASGETGKIYVALDSNKPFRWSGSAYVYITSGAVDSVAGKTGVVTLAKGDVGLGNVDNTSDASKPVSTATQTALDLKANLISPTFTTPSLGVATGTSFNSITGLSSTTPVMDGTAAVGTGTTTARGDHRHPTDTSRAPIASPTFTGEVKITDPSSKNLTIAADGTSVYANSDGHLYVGSSASADFAVITNSLDRFRINADGTITVGFVSSAETKSITQCCSAGYENTFRWYQAGVVEMWAGLRPSEAKLYFGTNGGTSNKLVSMDMPGNLNVIAPTGSIGYGVGAGGVVTQATSKSTAVTLNKPCGSIILHSEAVAIGGVRTFYLYNSLISEYDALALSFVDRGDGVVGDGWIATARMVPGLAVITLQNVAGQTVAGSFTLNFIRIKGAVS